jgi:hypothetical protein
VYQIVIRLNGPSFFARGPAHDHPAAFFNHALTLAH